MGQSKMVGEGQTKILFLIPDPPWRALSPQGEGHPLLIDTVDSATPELQNPLYQLAKDVLLLGERAPARADQG